jgi:hypothetical protein
MIWIVSLLNKLVLSGKVIVKAAEVELAKILSFTTAWYVVLTSRITIPAVPVVDMYLPMF